MRVICSILLFFFTSCSSNLSTDSDSGVNQDLPANAIIEELGEGITKITVNDASGNITVSGTLSEGKRAGTWVEYYPNGIVKSITPYVNGQIEGVRTEFSNGGQFEKSFEYHLGMLHGIYKEWRYSSVKEQRFYQNGKLEGLVKIYYDNGKIMEEGLYKNGTRDGLSKWYDQEGNLSIEYEYKNGELIKK